MSEDHEIKYHQLFCTLLPEKIKKDAAPAPTLIKEAVLVKYIDPRSLNRYHEWNVLFIKKAHYVIFRSVDEVKNKSVIFIFKKENLSPAFVKGHFVDRKSVLHFIRKHEDIYEPTYEIEIKCSNIHFETYLPNSNKQIDLFPELWIKYIRYEVPRKFLNFDISSDFVDSIILKTNNIHFFKWIFYSAGIPLIEKNIQIVKWQTELTAKQKEAIRYILNMNNVFFVRSPRRDNIDFVHEIMHQVNGRVLYIDISKSCDELYKGYKPLIQEYYSLFFFKDHYMRYKDMISYISQKIMKKEFWYTLKHEYENYDYAIINIYGNIKQDTLLNMFTFARKVILISDENHPLFKEWYNGAPSSVKFSIEENQNNESMIAKLAALIYLFAYYPYKVYRDFSIKEVILSLHIPININDDILTEAVSVFQRNENKKLPDGIHTKLKDLYL